MSNAREDFQRFGNKLLVDFAVIQAELQRVYQRVHSISLTL